MKIVIAAWHLKDFNVGLGRYSRALIEALGRVDIENQYEILMPSESHRFPERPNMHYRLIRFPFFKRRFWEQVAPLLVGPHDLLHLPYDSCVAWKRGKLVVTIHDVKPFLFDSLRPRRSLARAIEKRLAGDKWQRIDHILTDSDHSRRDIEQLFGVPSERITVVYPGVDLDRFRPVPMEEGGPVRPYILSVAGADPTKNVEALIEAFAGMSSNVRDGHDLVLVGDFRRRPELRERTVRLGIEKHTTFAGVVDDDRLIALYRRAALFVFPSRYEGFGLPVLEAMACGCPVVCSNASSLPEVAGDGAILVDPADTLALSRQMDRALTEPSLREGLRERGLRQAARFSWERTARETVKVYERVAG